MTRMVVAALMLTPLILINLTAEAVDTFTLHAGSTLRVRLGTSLSGKDAQTGDEFTGDVAEPIIAAGEEVVPTGSAVAGKVLAIRQGGRSKSAAELRLTLERITTPAGVKYLVSSANHDAGNSAGRTANDDAKTSAGPEKQSGSNPDAAALSAVITATATSGVRSVLKKHQEIEVSPGTEIDFVAKRDVTLSKAATRQ
jgi:hypothetical protein